MAGKRYDKAPENLLSRVRQVMAKHHARLLEPAIKTSVRIETYLVYGPRNKNGEQTGVAITVRGATALACIRLTNLEERVAGRADAVLWIDGDEWKTWGPDTLSAIIDHELTHLELALDPRTGEKQFDDAGRIRLRMRPHDVEVGWFDEVAERHAEYSVEVQQATKIVNARQMYFPGFDIKPRIRKRRA